MRITAALFAFFASCSHLTSQPVTGMLGRQCGQERIVYCQSDLTHGDCQQVREAIDYFNGRTALNLFRWGGYKPERFPAGATAENLIVQYHDERRHILPDVPVMALATVQRIRRDTDGCITHQSIVIIAYSDEMTTASFQSMLRHELGHAAGLDHVAEETTDSLMNPFRALNLTEPMGLTEWDLNMLHAMYARVLGAR